jgi:replicative DNA helicase
MQEHLGKFGYSFQIKILSSIVTDLQFVSRVYDILLPEYFDNENMAFIYEIVRKYFHKYHILPSLDVFKQRIESIEDDDTKKELVISVLEDVWDNIDSDDLEDIREETISFCVNQSVVKALFESAVLVKERRYDEILTSIEDALRKGAADIDDPNKYKDDIENRYAETARNPISTGFRFLDEIMDGGLAGGELGVVAGPGGSGKSWILQALSANAVDTGKRVLYISLELSKNYVEIRHDMIFTKMSKQSLKDNLDILQRRLNTLSGELEVKWYPTKKFTIIKLRATIDKMILLQRKPDLIVIDYPDLMKLPNDRNKRKDELLQDLYEELRGIGGEYNIPLWVATQTRRSSIKLDEIEADEISESMGKHYTSDFMMSISRKLEDKAAKSARFTIMKSRLGDDGLTAFGKMDTKNGVIDIYGIQSKAKALPEGDSGKKKLLKSLWKDSLEE